MPDRRPPPSARFEYRPALDGVRAFAVLAVLLYHGDQPWARGGFLGVDTFFVLSGFLITSLLVTEWNRTGTLDLRAFWARRARRLLPALGLVVVGIGIYAAAFARSDELGRIRVDGLATLAYSANWRFVLSGQSYFDQFTQPSPFRHMWSLAIEEQFYLVWPLVVGGVLAWRRSVAALFRITVVGAIGSAALMAVLYRPGSDPSRVYYGTDTRVQAMLLGAAAGIALLGRRPLAGPRARLVTEGVGWCAALVLLGAWWQASESSAAMYRGGFFVVALAAVAVIAVVSEPHPGTLGLVLSWRPLRWVGAVSYGLYLWHWPVYLALTPGRVGRDGVALLAVRLAVTTALATASYYLVEMPVRRGEWFRTRARTLTAVASGALVVVVLVGSTRGGTESVDLSQQPPPAHAPRAEPGRIRVLVQGDSVAGFLGDAMLRDQAANDLLVWNRARWGCSLGFGATPRVGPANGIGPCPDWHRVFRREVAEFRPDVVVVVSGAFEIFDRTVDGRVLPFGSPAFDRYYRMLLDDAIDTLVSRGAHVVLLQSPHPLRSDSLWETKPEWSQDQRWRTQHYNALIRRVVAAHPATASTLDLVPIVCPSDPCPDTVDGVQFRGDGVHWTDTGGDVLARWLDPQLHALGAAASTSGSRARGTGG